MFRTLKFLALPIIVLVLSQPVWAKNPSSALVGEPLSHARQNLSASHDSSAAQTSEPAGTAPGETPYTICPGDVLQITVWKEDSLNKEVLVLPDGTISFPLIGSFKAAGLTPAQLQACVRVKLGPYIPDAAVTVMVKAALGHTVNVIGQVTKPGEIMMGHRLTVMEALSQAGGLTPYADEGRIIVLHRKKGGKEISIPFPYSDIVDGDDLNKDVVLSPGDVVVVPTAGLL
ncbi:MAG TPA: polysaccharide biosynthesis/export family protein [Alphaproteobacteria bacterium]|nr:polysaccharide biosynthesis/export family protein [Alphaproteobacteria bacterium]